MSGLPDWVSAELSRRAEEDRIDRKAAYDQWAAGYADSGVRADTQPGTEDEVPDGRISLLPRWAHFLYARSMGYFWDACPLCGRHFGGHEWRDINGNMSSLPVPGGAICPQCTRNGRAHAAGRDRDGRTLRIGQPVTVADEGRGIFICPVADGSANALVWLTGSRELVTLPERTIILGQGD